MAVTVTITVKPVNDAPLAVADSYRVDEDQLLAIDAAFGLLANDVDVDDDVLSAILVSDVSDGTLSLESDGSFSYQPDENFVGGDSFTYLASDTVAESNEVTVAIVVDPVNDAPVARDDAYNVDNGATLIIDAAGGVLANDSDVDDDALVAQLDAAPANGTLTLSDDGSFTYTPDAGFSGTDSFTYRAGDSTATSNIATVSIDVAELVNEPFGPVKPGAFDDPNLLGIRTDLVPGAPPLTAEHVSTAFNYDGFSSPPTYGPHHGFLLDAQNNSITPRPTGVYSSEQPDEDLIHNLEHGHVWISYNPDLLGSADLTALKRLVEDGGGDTGVILTPRARNTSAIALASWAHLLTLDSFDATQIRDFVETNRGHADEGFIPSGQKGTSNESENLDDGLPHTPSSPTDPFLQKIDDVVLLSGSPLHIPLDGFDPNGGELTFTASSDNPDVSTDVLEGNRSMRITVDDFGDMVFELFEGRAGRATDRIIALAEDDFYDDIIFHRVDEDFVIQGGNQTITGGVPSTLGNFDDQFHFDLQHNRTGVLSMAKTEDDDSNGSQFFITVGAARHLDFNHSVFGQLVEGFSIFEAITEVPVGAGDRPLTPVVMNSVDIFVDEENGMLMLSAQEGFSGEANVTVTVSDTDGNTFERTFHVTVEPDSFNGGPFLSDIEDVPPTAIDVPAVFLLEANDVEGDDVIFDAVNLSDEILVIEVFQESGVVLVTPPAGFVGTVSLLGRVRPDTFSDTGDLYDTQIVEITWN